MRNPKKRFRKEETNVIILMAGQFMNSMAMYSSTKSVPMGGGRYIVEPLLSKTGYVWLPLWYLGELRL
jgi:hypothetical protein